MYGTGHSSSTGQDIQAALLLLEAALAKQEQDLDGARDRGEPAAAALLQHLALMRDEAERLRSMLPR
jgi:hypothetical protein